MPPLAKDLAFLRSAAVELEAYLLSGELYWHLTPLREDRGVGELISLTPGNLMLCLTKVKYFLWNAEEMAEVQGLISQVEGEITRWRFAWRKKIAREMSARVKQWQDELAEASQEKALIDYPFKVRNRAILDCFDSTDVLITPVLGDLISMLDERLMHLTVASGFIWEPEVASGFNPYVYWYLYRSPAKG